MAEGFKAGSIYAELTMEKGKWSSSVKEVTADTESLKKSASSWGDKVGGVGKAFTAAGAVVAGSLVAMMKSTANVGDQIAKLSVKTGLSTETLSSYRLAADLAGSSLEGVAKGLKGLSKVMVEAKEGTGEGADAFKELGLTATDSEGKMKPLDAMMEEVADKFAGMEAGAVKSDLAVRLFGKAGLDLIPVLNMGGKALRENRVEAERLGMVFSKEAAASCESFNDRITELKYGLGGTAKELVMSVMPTVTDFVRGITNTVVKIREWVQAHPELAKQIVGIGLKVGALLVVLGPVLIIVPKIVALFQGWWGTLSKLPGAISSAVTSIASMNAGTLASIGLWGAAAAAIGFYVVKLYEKKKAEDYATEATARAKEASEALRKKLEEAMRQAGMSAEAIAELEKKYRDAAKGDESWVAAMGMSIHKGKESKEVQEALIKVGDEHAAALEKQTKATELAAIATAAALEAQKKWTEFLQGAGIMTVKEKTDRLGVLSAYLGQAEGLYKSGKISVADYAKAIQAASDEAAGMGMAWKTALPPAQDLMKAVRMMPSTVEGAVYAYKTFEDQIKDVADTFMVSEATIVKEIYNIRRQLLALSGINLPAIDFSPIEGGAKTATTNMGNSFDGLYNDIAQGFGATVQKWAEGGMSLRGVARDLWGNIKSSFFTMVGEMTSAAVLGQFKGLFSGIAKGGEDAVGSATSSIGKSITGLGTGLGGLITTLATAIATAATTLAAAAPAIITVGAIALGIFAGFKLIESIFGGGGGGKQSDVTYWLKMIKDNSQILVNFISGNYLDMVSRMTAKLESINDDKFGALLDQQYPQTDFLRQIAQNTENTYKILDKAKFAQGGFEGMVPRPTMIVAGERRPEWVSIRPLSEPRAIPLAAGAGTGPTISVGMNINVTLDPMSDRDAMRRRFMPEFLAALEANFMKSQIRQQLG